MANARPYGRDGGADGSDDALHTIKMRCANEGTMKARLRPVHQSRASKGGAAVVASGRNTAKLDPSSTALVTPMWPP